MFYDIISPVWHASLATNLLTIQSSVVVHNHAKTLPVENPYLEK